ncbi:MAG: RNA pyrophosphohydrolase [Gammaproteobacteria bacterium]|nr:RNA pyrophosphohydrolase [Gammaproteobacteria bacterium]|tara:strand:+ start:574 stop:1056 length:483 start_codon:yes stop_codon:yes gene_type:complete
MIDSEGYRPNVGIVICNRKGQLLWAKRVGQSAWQFPQGGIDEDETIEQALFRELEEEVGLQANDVTVLHQTKEWLYYELPKNYVRFHNDHPCIGQKQKWFLLGLESEESRVELDKSDEPEFDDWRWVSYWYPVSHVIKFKRDVYRRALNELLVPLEQYVK